MRLGRQLRRSETVWVTRSGNQCGRSIEANGGRDGIVVSVRKFVIWIVNTDHKFASSAWYICARSEKANWYSGTAWRVYLEEVSTAFSLFSSLYRPVPRRIKSRVLFMVKLAASSLNTIELLRVGWGTRFGGFCTLLCWISAVFVYDAFLTDYKLSQLE